ncbi:MAG: YceI family protein [Rhizobiales bacterium]|nr:YceI family protein [Hyphomicrobiales bacterium]
MTGGFGAFDAEIVFDPDDLDASRIAVDIDVTSIATGHSDRDKTLNSPSFFDTAKWPSAAFKSRTITATGDGTYEAAGQLTMRDVTREVVLPFSLVIEDDPDDPNAMLAHARGELPIQRLDYGIGQGDWASTATVADEVVITIDIRASRPKG